MTVATTTKAETVGKAAAITDARLPRSNVHFNFAVSGPALWDSTMKLFGNAYGIGDSQSRQRSHHLTKECIIISTQAVPNARPMRLW
jgi:hypothetical protein